MSPTLFFLLVGIPFSIITFWMVTASVMQTRALRCVQNLDIARGDRIGLLVDCGASPTHTHYGMMPFIKFKRPYSYDWKLKTEVMNALTSHLAEAGLIGVDLLEAGAQPAEFADFIRLRWGKWLVSDAAVLRRLRDQFKLKALIVVKEKRVIALSESGGEASAGWVGHAEATGLFTRTEFWRLRCLAVVACQWNVYWLDPPADLALARPLSEMLEVPSERLRAFERPLDFENLTELELEPVRHQVLAIIDQTASTAIQCFTSRAGA